MRNSKPLCKMAVLSNKVKTLLLAIASYARSAPAMTRARATHSETAFKMCQTSSSLGPPQADSCLQATFGFSTRLALNKI